MSTTIAIVASASGNTTLIAGVAGRRIRVVAGLLSFGGTVNAKFVSGSNGDITGLYYGILGTQVGFDYAGEGMGGIREHFVSVAQGDSLVINLSGNVAVGGHLVYELVP